MDQEPGPMTLTQEDLRLVGLWAADCAERVLPLFEAKAPSDTRPREAIEGIRAFARGGKRTARLRSLAWEALAAAREVGDPRQVDGDDCGIRSLAPDPLVRGTAARGQRVDGQAVCLRESADPLRGEVIEPLHDIGTGRQFVRLEARYVR